MQLDERELRGPVDANEQGGRQTRYRALVAKNAPDREARVRAIAEGLNR
jgi:hypothetical protein